MKTASKYGIILTQKCEIICKKKRIAMDEHINNSNTTENTDKQPYNNYDYSDEEYALKWKNAVPKGVQENTGVL